MADVVGGLDGASGGEVEELGQPEGVVGECGEEEKDAEEEDQRGNGRGEEHAARGGDADEDAVPDEGGDTGGGDEIGPPDVLAGGLYDGRLVGEQAEERHAAQHVDHGEQQGHGGAPMEQAPHHVAEGAAVLCAPVAASQCLAGIGEAVHDIREEQVELHEQRIDGQDGGALPRPGSGEIQVDGHQAQCAQEDVAVDTEECCKRRAATAGRSGRGGAVQAQRFPVIAPQQCPGNKEAGILRHQRADGNALDAPSQPVDQTERGHDVDHVLQYADKHGQTGVLHADEPSRQAVELQHGRGAPHHDVIIRDGQRSDVGRRRYEP